MRYLGLDLGTRTLGISISDETKTIATGLTTLRFSDSAYDEIDNELIRIVKEYKVEKIILGFPKNMNNTIGERAETTIVFKEKIEKLLKERLKNDRTKTQVEGFTKLDLMEMTRKHICSHKE